MESRKLVTVNPDLLGRESLDFQIFDCVLPTCEGLVLLSLVLQSIKSTRERNQRRTQVFISSETSFLQDS